MKESENNFVLPAVSERLDVLRKKSIIRAQEAQKIESERLKILWEETEKKRFIHGFFALCRDNAKIKLQEAKQLSKEECVFLASTFLKQRKELSSLVITVTTFCAIAVSFTAGMQLGWFGFITGAVCGALVSFAFFSSKLSVLRRISEKYSSLETFPYEYIQADFFVEKEEGVIERIVTVDSMYIDSYRL